jgi:hypothetical protein
MQEEENNVYVVIELLNMSQLLKGVERGVKTPPLHLPADRVQLFNEDIYICYSSPKFGIIFGLVFDKYFSCRRTLMTFDGSEARETLINSRDSSKGL